MSKDLEAWGEVLELVRPRITKTGFTSFFGNLKLLYIKDDVIYASCTHSIIRDMFDMYRAVTMESIFKVFNQPMELKLLVEEEITEEMKMNMNSAKKVSYDSDCNLNPKFTFENFVVGKNNEFAYSVAYAIAQSEEYNERYNPLLIYGGSGLGKTHLLQAVGNEIMKKFPEKKLVYITSENFVNDFIESIRTETMSNFRERFRNIDVLLLDDIQFFAGKTGMQEEFFNTFNQLVSQNKQIILSSDRPPKDINPLEERLKTRLAGGVMPDIQPPDYETRMAILHSKVNLNNFMGNISDDIFELVAKQVKSSIRELEGAIRTIIAYSDISKKDIDIDTANRLLKDYFVESQRRKIDAEYIIKEVERHFNLKNETLVSSKRDKEISYPRQVAMYICRELTQLSFPEIGKAFGGRNHATVVHNVNKIKEEMESDLSVLNNVKELIKNISNDED